MAIEVEDRIQYQKGFLEHLMKNTSLYEFSKLIQRDPIVLASGNIIKERVANVDEKKDKFNILNFWVNLMLDHKRCTPEMVEILSKFREGLGETLESVAIPKLKNAINVRLDEIFNTYRDKIRSAKIINAFVAQNLEIGEGISYDSLPFEGEMRTSNIETLDPGLCYYYHQRNRITHRSMIPTYLYSRKHSSSTS